MTCIYFKGYGQNLDKTKDISHLQEKAQNYLMQGKLDSSLIYYYHAIKSSYEKKDTSLIVFLNCKVAEVLIHKSNFEIANDSLIRALKLAELTNNKENIFFPLLFLADYNIKQKDSSEAKFYLNKATEIIPHIEENKLFPFYYNLRVSYNVTFNINAEIDFSLIDKAIELGRKNKDSTSLLFSLSIKSILYIRKNDFENSIPIILENIKITRLKKHYGALASELANLGIIYSLQNKYTESEKCFIEAKEIFSKIDRKFMYEVLLALSELKEKQNDYQSALVYYKEYSTLKDSIINVEKLKYIDELSVKYKTEKKEKEIIILNAENKLKETENMAHKKNQIIILFAGIFSILMLSIVFIFAFRSYKLKQKTKIEKIEKEKVRAELTMLKNQISPHVMFNSLNTIYYQLEENSEAAGDMILKFSDLLRFQLYECNADFITIEKEIEYIKEFVSFHKLRKSLRCQINLNIGDDIRNFKISPLLIIPLLENAFKYVSNEKNTDNFVSILLKKRRGILIFSIENTTFDKNEISNHYGGIGLINLKNRLELIYPKKYKLSISKKNRVFKANLLIYV